MAWRNIDVVIPDKLYLGNINAARSTRSVTEHHITHILSVCEDLIPAEDPQSGFSHMRIAIEDVDYADLLIHLPSACQFIDQAVKSGGVVLVHCYQGLSRSAAVVAAYLMWSQGLGATEAIDLVRAARDQIWINAGFQEQLILFELCQYAPSPTNGFYISWRAKMDRQLKEAGLLSVLPCRIIICLQLISTSEFVHYLPDSVCRCEPKVTLATIHVDQDTSGRPVPVHELRPYSRGKGKVKMWALGTR